MNHTTKARLFRLGTAAVLLVAATGMSALGSLFIRMHFPDRPLVPDLLFEVIPSVAAFQYISDSVATVIPFALLALLVALQRRDADRAVGDAVSMAAMMYALRACVIVMTPMLSPHGNKTGTYGLLPPQTGMFPSGHTALSFLCYLLVSRGGAGGPSVPAPARIHPWLRWVFGLMVGFEMVGLLFGRGHYSIDLVGGLLLGYFIHAEWTLGVLFNPVKHLLNRNDPALVPVVHAVSPAEDP